MAPHAPAKSNSLHHNNDRDCSVVASIPYWDQKRATRSFKKNIDVIDHLSVFWYYINPKGKIKKYRYAYLDKQLIDYAHANGVKVFAVITNLPDDEVEGESDWDQERVARVIASPSRRQAHITDILRLSTKIGYDGIIIDYEALPKRLRDKYSAFIHELANALHASNKLLAVALHPKTSEFNPKEDNGSHAQDWATLTRYADQMHLMTYDQHTAATRPGAAGSPAWINRVLKYAANKQKLDHTKLYLGIPLYATAWEHVSFGSYRGLQIDLTYSDVQRIKRELQVSETWSNAGGAPFLKFRTKKGSKRIIWFENRESMKLKLALGQSYGLCNVFLWRLGGEDPGVWDNLRDA